MLAYFAVQTILITALVIVTHTSDPFTFPFFVLSIQAMTVFSQRSGIAWIVLFYAISSASALWNRGASGAINILLNTAAFFFVGVFAYLLRQAEQNRREKEQLLEELRATQRQLQNLAVAEERNRLARDLHDSVKQQAFALSAQLDAVHSLIGRDPPAAERHLCEAEQLADSLRHELAGMILELRPPALGHQGLPAALRQYAAEWARQSAIEATVDVQGERALPSEVENTLFRIVQEALSNVARHSQARTAGVRLEYAPGCVTLMIQDDGQGFDPQQINAGVGAYSMRERAALLPNGVLSLESMLGQGTRVIVRCQA
jgi:signal transduction histidine kinase